jgi:hypothetical protein
MKKYVAKLKHPLPDPTVSPMIEPIDLWRSLKLTAEHQSEGELVVTELEGTKMCISGVLDIEQLANEVNCFCLMNCIEKVYVIDGDEEPHLLQ